MTGAMRENEIDTVRFHRSPVTHFVRYINEPWSGRGGKATTYCGRVRDANDIEPRKFSTVRSWCVVCYHARRKAIEREVRAWPGDR